MSMKKRVVSLVLALSLCTSFFVVSAFALFDFSLSLADIEVSLNAFFSDTNNDNYKPYVCNSIWAKSHHNTYSYSSLESYVLSLNSSSEQYGFKFSIQPLQDTNYYGVRILYQTGAFGSGRRHEDQYASYVVAWLADELGNAVLSTPGTASITSVRAIPVTQARSMGYYKMLSYEDLYNLAYDYNSSHDYTLALNSDGIYWAINARNGQYVLANESGLPYGAPGPTSVTSGGSRPDVTTNDDHIIDWLNNTVGTNDGVIGFDNVLYDSNNKTYYIDNSTSFQNSFNQTYYYNWSFTYNIDYTNITYIGSSAEYTETYECYYELPDGRSSADLTKEDLEQLNLSMDVVPYIRSSDDTRLRSLYHFDGNTEDASYWNYQTSFDWNAGASLTYLESNAFNGCLYLDELAHDFTITLPSSLGSGDFTVDFRYYQSATVTPQNDSYVKIGGQEVLRLDGSHFVFNGTNYATPVGSWNHLAFIRENGTLKFYLNGVQQGSKALSNVLSSAVQFSFGTSQQTFKYLDELRVTNFAVWEDNFFPPTVPYDTNLALVLPTDTVPVADEYWDIDIENTNLLSQFDVDYWYSNDAPDNQSFIIPQIRSGRNLRTVVERYSSDFSSSSWSYVSDAPASDIYSDNVDVEYLSKPFLSPYCTYSLLSSASIASSLGFPYVLGNSMDEYDYIPYPNGFFLPSIYSEDAINGFSLDRPYTLTMVTSQGDIGYFTFDNRSLFRRSGVQFGFSDSNIFNGYIISFFTACCWTYDNFSGFSIIPTADAGEFVYLAIEEGTESTVTAEFVSGIAGIPADELNTSTLAVRSDIPITDHQIGGVRPTFAERGYVYAMVESGYITSLQQYTGYSWQAVDGRIWTGTRWIPYSSYNVITLSDMYDIPDASGQSGYEYIYSENGFWSWWQKQWLSFVDLFKQSGGSSGGGSGGSGITENTTNNITNNEYTGDVSVTNVIKESGKSMWDFISGLLGTVGGVFSETGDAVSGITDVFSEPEDDTSVWYLFDVPYEMMSPVEEDD